MTKSSLTESLRETLALFDAFGAPQTTIEVADQLDLGRRSTYERLERLVDHGELETKKAGSNGRVWWRPHQPTGTRAGDAEERPTVADSLVEDVLDDAAVGVFVLDDEYNVAWINDTLERYFGLDRAYVIGRDKRELVEDRIAPIVEDGDSLAETVLATYEENTYAERFECHVTAGEGRDARWLEHRSKPIESGAFAGGRVELYYDVTEQKRSERALRDEQTRFETLVDAVEEYAIFMLDADGYVRSWNAGAERIKGYRPDEVLGEHISTFYTEEDRAAGVPERNLEQAAETGSIEDEGWRIRNDGTRFRANVTIAAIRADDGTVRGFLKVTRDMTDRYRREQNLESELQRILGRISDAFYAVDDQLRFTHVNEQAAKLLQRSEAELLGEAVWDVFPDARETRGDEAFRHALEAQEFVSYEEQLPSLEKWFDVRVYPSETGLSVYFRDITERKERQQELERYEQTVETVWDGVYALDENDRFVLVNEAFCELVGYEREELLGEPPTLINSEAVNEAANEMEAEIVTGQREVGVLEYEFETADGATIPVETRFRPYHYGDGRTGRCGVTRDIRDRKEYERKLEESNERLEQFAYIASHDLQEPLRMVTSYLRLLEQRYGDAFDEDGEEFLEFAVDGAERMREMIDGLLKYSRVETHGDSFEPVDLNTVLEDVRADLQFQTEETDAEITTEDLPRVDGDASQLRQLLQNLLDNAITYSGEHPPRVHVTADRRSQEWVISVEDEGIGIDPDYQERVFTIFDRLHSREEYNGMGIGLALCERIVERHGGDIWVESELGEGATFSFTLPA
ncbi:PAS domain-containing sensor histidine kinase [Natrinema caseinilyticum]|uniref:PAS domain-containing sensor histidine kinase n=1 Tax=Natrinema caseinilyticum TaxID=2961570 RepID=UPI0020C2D57E|nr:PAS domain S-box protein [Natrinema caseinilyticum]